MEMNYVGFITHEYSFTIYKIYNIIITTRFKSWKTTAASSGATTTIGRATGSAGFDASGNPLYRNRNTESASDKAKRKANREIKEMAERLSADQSIIVI